MCQTDIENKFFSWNNKVSLSQPTYMYCTYQPLDFIGPGVTEVLITSSSSIATTNVRVHSTYIYYDEAFCGLMIETEHEKQQNEALSLVFALPARVTHYHSPPTSTHFLVKK